jgi:hypothetical protein
MSRSTHSFADVTTDDEEDDVEEAVEAVFGENDQRGVNRNV